MALMKARVELNRTHVLAVGVSLAAPKVALTTQLVLARANALTPVKTGNLRNQNKMTMRARRTFVAGTVENRAKYAHMVHGGTRAHVIRPRRKKALAFYWKKKRQHVVLRQVRHPGTKARPWLLRALEEVAPAQGFIVTPATGRGVVGGA